jgi:hypothetical protein
MEDVPLNQKTWYDDTFSPKFPERNNGKNPIAHHSFSQRHYKNENTRDTVSPQIEPSTAFAKSTDNNNENTQEGHLLEDAISLSTRSSVNDASTNSFDNLTWNNSEDLSSSDSVGWDRDDFGFSAVQKVSVPTDANESNFFDYFAILEEAPNAVESIDSSESSFDAFSDHIAPPALIDPPEITKLDKQMNFDKISNHGSGKQSFGNKMESFDSDHSYDSQGYPRKDHVAKHDDSDEVETANKKDSYEGCTASDTNKHSYPSQQRNATKNPLYGSILPQPYAFQESVRKPGGSVISDDSMTSSVAERQQWLQNAFKKSADNSKVKVLKATIDRKISLQQPKRSPLPSASREPSTKIVNELIHKFGHATRYTASNRATVQQKRDIFEKAWVENKAKRKDERTTNTQWHIAADGGSSATKTYKKKIILENTTVPRKKSLSELL